MTTYAIEMQNVYKSFRRTEVLRGVSLTRSLLTTPCAVGETPLDPRRSAARVICGPRR